MSELEARRQQVSRAYNSKLDVKEKNKLRRKKRDQRISARLKATDWYLSKLASTLNGDAVTFPAIVAAHLPPKYWPRDGLAPGQEQMDRLLRRIEDVLNLDLNRLYSVFSQWRWLSVEEQMESWKKEAWLAVREHLGSTSLWEISSAKELVDKKQEEILEGSIDVLNFGNGIDLE